MQSNPFTSSQLITVIRTIYLGGKKSKFKLGANGPPKLTSGMVVLATVVVSNHDLLPKHRDASLTFIE
jgi:hypothetical protein